MEFRILGPVEVEEEGRTIPLAGPKQRALLALLLLARSRPVSTDRLIDDIWSGVPPQHALKSVQVYVSQLRKALGDGRVVTHGRGYQLVVEPGELDVDRFDELVRSASGAAPEDAAERLRDALALFRGEPLADLQLEPWAQGEIARIEERRLAAVEARIEADLALGRHGKLVAELETLVEAHPFRERPIEYLVLALYRAGRTADALDSYRRWAARVRDELGLDPSRRLEELERRVLQHDPALDLPPDPSAHRDPRRRGWTFVLAGAGVLFAAAAAAAAMIVTRDTTASLASVPPGMAIVDASSGRLVAHVPWAEVPFPVSVISGNGSFWVWTLDGNALVRIDPHSGRVLRRISSPFGADTYWANVDGRNVWFTGTRLARMDIASGAEASQFALTDDPHNDGLDWVARGAGSLWITRPKAGELLRVDPSTGRIQHRFGNLSAPYPVAFGAGAAWVVSASSVARIDAATDTVTSVSLPPPIAAIAVGGGFAWASNEAKGIVYKIDRSGRVVASYETGDGARDMSYADGTLWVVNTDVGTVTGIDAATGAERTFRFGHPLLSVGALHGTLLVEVNQGRTYEDRIDALPGKVARLIVPIYQFSHPDPAVEEDGTGHNAFMSLAERATCAPLLGYPDAPPPRGQRLAPEVAIAMPTLSPNRRTYTFRVRPGFRFAPPSNAALDAETFRYSIERALDAKLGPLAPGIGLLGDLEGAHAFHSGRATHVSGIGVRGDRISFTLTKPSPDFLERLALPFFCPVPLTTPVVAGGVGVFTGPAPAGAGPYSFSGPVFNGEYAILKRNPNYGGSRPQRLDAIAFREGIDTEKAVGMVEQGRFDSIEQPDPLLAPGGEVARRFGAADPPGEVVYRSFAQPVTAYLALDAGRLPFSDPKLRHAVASALDRAKLAGFWSQTPTERLLPPAVRGGSAATARPADLARARRLAGTRRVSVYMAVRVGDERGRQFVDVVHAALAPLGIDVEPIAVADVEATLRENGSLIRLAALTTTLDYPDPASFLTQMLGKDVPVAWLPASTRSAVNRLNRLTGTARDRAAVALAGRLATRDVPVVAFGTPPLAALVGPRLGCRVWNGTDPGFDLAALCLVTH